MGAHGHGLTGTCSGERGHKDLSTAPTTETRPQSPRLDPGTLLKVEVPIVRASGALCGAATAR